jgi:hypothetical protein
MSERAMLPAQGLLPLPHVQLWETENSWRLDSSHRGGDRRDIPCLVDASDVHTVNALKKPSGLVNEFYGMLVLGSPKYPLVAPGWGIGYPLLTSD